MAELLEGSIVVLLYMDGVGTGAEEPLGAALPEAGGGGSQLPDGIALLPNEVEGATLLAMKELDGAALLQVVV